ncbi:MAG: GH3 auxin-responsive promoter, partial [Proteobacteria bacterium]
MALFDISLPPSIAKALHLPGKSPERQQNKVLKKLLKKARFTEFGQQYHFDEILLAKKKYEEFRKRVP